jgi:hypothetical protein
MSKTLTQIRESNRLIESLLEAQDGLVTPELETLMSDVSQALPEKIDSYYHVRERIKSEITYLNARETELRNHRKSLENAEARLSENLKYHMKQTGETELLGNDYRFKLSASKPKLIIENENALPAGYVQEVVVKEPQKDRIKEDLEMGLTVPGAKLEQSNQLRSYPVTKQVERKKKGGAA